MRLRVFVRVSGSVCVFVRACLSVCVLARVSRAPMGKFSHCPERQ